MKPLLASLLTLCLLAACGTIPSTPTSSASPAPTTAIPPINPSSPETPDLSLFRDGLISSVQPILDQMADASRYTIELNIEDDLIHVNGKEQVRYANREDVPLNEIQFRLFPNILGGSMEVSNVKVDSKPVTPKFGLAKSQMIVPLETPLQVGASLVITMDFTVEVPTSLESGYGLMDYHDGVLSLSHAYPAIPVYNEEGWNAEIPPQLGDITFTDVSFYAVTVTAPKGLTVVGSGIESQPETNGNLQTVQIEAGPARDFLVVLSKDYQVASRKVGEVIVNSYAPKSLAEGNRSALEVAVRALETYSDEFAPYPYTELDILVTPTNALGIEYPGAVAIADRILRGEYGDATSTYLEATVAHEVGHQWFYNLVGNDQLDEPWLDESLTQFATWQYYEINYGAGGAEGFKESLLARWNRVGDEAIPIGKPVSSYSDIEYGAIVYGRGALFFDALRTEMGSATFDAFLKDYVSTYAWGIASTQRLKSLAEKDCGCDLKSLFEEWVYP